MQDDFYIFLPALIGLGVLSVIALFHFDRSAADPKPLDSPTKPDGPPTEPAPEKPPH